MKHLFVLNALLLSCLFAFAQQENYNMQWVQGMPRTFKTTFTTAGPVNQFWDSTHIQLFSQGHSNICTGAGDLVLATEGANIYDASRQVIDNGDSILCPLAGIIVGAAGTQTTIILPLGDSIYYVFNTTWSDSQAYKFWILGQHSALQDQVRYHVVDMKENNYAGKVVQKNKIAFNGVKFAASNMTAVRHGNGTDWWLVKQGAAISGNVTNTYTFLVTQDTVIGPTVQAYPNIATYSFGSVTGQSAFNESGTKYAAVDHSRFLFLADFDRCTGLFTNAQRMYVPEGSPIDSQPTGACFSPNDSFLYVTTFGSVHQLEINNPDSATAWVYIAGADTIGSYFNSYLSLHLGHDQKIYIGNANNNGSTMSVINNPNAKGALADFCPKCLRFPKFMNTNVSVTQPPNMPNYVLGIDPICPPNPNTISSIKTTESIRLYPNPATSSITIEYPTTGGILELVDMMGRVQLRAELKAGSTKAVVSTAGLPAGVYVYRCLLRNEKMVSGRLLIYR